MLLAQPVQRTRDSTLAGGACLLLQTLIQIPSGLFCATLLAFDTRGLRILKPPGILPIQCQQTCNIARNQFFVRKLLGKRIVGHVESFQMLQLPKIEYKVSLEFR